MSLKQVETKDITDIGTTAASNLEVIINEATLVLI